MVSVRHALPADESDVHDTLVEAFLTDPIWAWFMADPEREGFARAEDLRRIMEVELRSYFPCGHTYTVPGRAAALWAPPGHRPDLTEFIETFAALGDPERAVAAAEPFQLMAEYEPADPHFYLHLIGARDSARGQGLGSLLLERVHRVCDDEQIPAYLEASTERSAALYARHGYEQLAVIELAPGVALRPMLRAPQQS